MGSWEQQPRQGHMSKPRHMRAQAPQRAAGAPDMPARRGVHVPKGPARTGGALARSASEAHVAQRSRGASAQGARAGARGAAGNAQPPTPSHWNSRAAYIELARKGVEAACLSASACPSLQLSLSACSLLAAMLCGSPTSSTTRFPWARNKIMR